MKTFWRSEVAAPIWLAMAFGWQGVSAFAQGEASPPKTPVVIRDFAGRPIPPIAHELINLSRVAVDPGIKTARLPGWEYTDGRADPGAEFEGHPFRELWDSGLRIDNVTKQNFRVALVRKIHPDKDWQITEVVARTRKERLTEICDRKGHQVPPDHLLVGIVHEDDPRKPPVPRRPTELERIKYLEKNNGRPHPRGCIGDTQTARIAALLNLETGKLSRYTAKPLTCISPFFEPCLPD